MKILVGQTLDTTLATSEIFPISHIIQNYWKKQVLLQVFQLQFNCGANTIVKVSSSKLLMTLQTFGAKMATSGKFQST